MDTYAPTFFVFDQTYIIWKLLQKNVCKCTHWDKKCGGSDSDDSQTTLSKILEVEIISRTEKKSEPKKKKFLEKNDFEIFAFFFGFDFFKIIFLQDFFSFSIRIFILS